jgi:putative tricarboxylic transport membrane protein
MDRDLAMKAMKERAPAMADRVLGVLFILLGGLSIVDGFRVTREYRASAVFDDIGPDRYAIAVGALLAVLGVALIAMARSAPATAPAAARSNEPDQESPRFPPFVSIPLLLAAYTGVIPLIGYSLSTALFMVVMFYVAGVRPLPRSLAYGGVAGVVFYLLFVRISDMPLPASKFIPWF